MGMRRPEQFPLDVAAWTVRLEIRQEIRPARHWAWVPLPLLLIAVIGVWLADLRTPVRAA